MKKIDIPPEAGRAFMRALRRYHATKNGDKRTEIAARATEELSKHLPGKQVVEMEEIRELFRRMKP